MLTDLLPVGLERWLAPTDDDATKQFENHTQAGANVWEKI
jgi:hypothetical protein